MDTYRHAGRRFHLSGLELDDGYAGRVEVECHPSITGKTLDAVSHDLCSLSSKVWTIMNAEAKH